MKDIKDFFTGKITRKKLDELIQPYSTEEKTLEVGSFGKPAYGKYFPNKIGLDLDAGAGVDIVGSVEDLPFDDNSFFCVVCISVLEHVKDPKKAIAEMRRVLKPNHRLIFSVPFLFPLHETPRDFWRFTKYGLELLFEEGWEIEHFIVENSSQISLASLMQRVAYQTKLKFNLFNKILILFCAKVLSLLPNLIKEEYGDIRHQKRGDVIFPSGYFLVIRKK